MKVAIIGNGVGGITICRMLREKKVKAELEIFAEEPYPYYPRPKLIEFLRGDLAQEEIFYYPEDWYRKNEIRVRYLTPVISLKPAEKSLTLKNGEEAHFDFLVITTGSRANVPPFGNLHLEGIFTLRTLDDALAIKEWASSEAKSALVVGGGLLGLESAFSLTHLGLKVSVLDHSNRLLSRQLDEEGAELLRDLLERKGMEVVLNASCEHFLGEGKVTGVQLKDGRTKAGDLVLISAGVRPELSCLSESEILTEKGVVVDDQMRTNFPFIYAVGDVAQWRGKMWGIISPALDQAAIAASNIAGEEASYQGTVPANVLKVVSLDLITAGNTTPPESGSLELKAKDREKGIYLKLVLKDGVVEGAIALGLKKPGLAMNRMVIEKRALSPQEARKFLEESIS
jgi:nitrite reductase (NADH) large subunit